MYQCPACDSHDFQFLGSLGSRDHLRCFDCGIDYSHENTEENWEESEEWEESDESWADGDSDDGDALASAGFGTDEDYGSFSDIEDY